MTRPYITPPNTRIYAIGDLHGYREPLARMMDLIEEDARGRHIAHIEIVFLGDYVDRGPDSAGLLDDLIALKNQESPFRFVFLKGNHETGMVKFILNPAGPRQDWLEWGGIETLQSYGIAVDRAVPLVEQAATLSEKLNLALPERHADFLSDLKLFHQSGGYLFVHAGVRANFPLEEQSEQDLTFIRKGFLDYDGLHPWRVVHGHTITREPEMLPNRINVDTGLYQHGVLSCAVIENDIVEFIQVTL